MNGIRCVPTVAIVLAGFRPNPFVQLDIDHVPGNVPLEASTSRRFHSDCLA